jgi:hypothetical protein
MQLEGLKLSATLQFIGRVFAPNELLLSKFPKPPNPPP